MRRFVAIVLSLLLLVDVALAGEARLEKQQDNQGALNVPPNVVVAPPAAKGSQVPPNWQPFEFNGATYYVIPLEQRDPRAAAAARNLVLTPPEAKK